MSAPLASPDRTLPRAWTWAILPILVAVFVVALLAPFAARDPVAGVTASSGPFSDESWNVLGARNLVLLGRLSTDSWNTWLLTLPFTFLQAAVFTLLGVGIVQARLAVIGVVAATAALIVAGLRPLIGSRAASLAAIGYATSALVLFYGRLAFLEPLVGLFLAAGILALRRADEPRAGRWGLAGGLALSLAVMTKALVLVPVLALLAAVAVGAIWRPGARRWLLGAITSGSLVALGWAGLVLWPNREAVAVVVTQIYPPLGLPDSRHALVSNLSDFIGGRSGDHAVLLALPLLAFALAGGLRAAYLWRRGTLHGGFVVAGAAAALAAGLAVLAVVDYRPNRYLVAFLPAAAILAGWVLAGVERLPRRRGWIATVLALAVVAVPGLVVHAGWMSGGTSRLPAIQEAGVQVIPPGSIVAGGYSPLVALRVPAIAIVTRGAKDPVNSGDLYAAGARYVVSGDSPPWWTSLHPAAWADRRELFCFAWGKDAERICLYALP
jgi:4-amino-4-deoxy-L-arabinose transferase-like glycosyltransferase